MAAGMIAVLPLGRSISLALGMFVRLPQYLIGVHLYFQNKIWCCEYVLPSGLKPR